jgi:hypothetical protein
VILELLLHPVMKKTTASNNIAPVIIFFIANLILIRYLDGYLPAGINNKYWLNNLLPIEGLNC